MAGTTIPEGATLKAKWFASDGAFIRRNGSVVESIPIADVLALIQAAILSGDLDLVIKSPDNTSYQITVANGGGLSTTAV